MSRLQAILAQFDVDVAALQSTTEEQNRLLFIVSVVTGMLRTTGVSENVIHACVASSYRAGGDENAAAILRDAFSKLEGTTADFLKGPQSE